MPQDAPDSKDNYRRFNEQVRAHGEVWGLRGDDGWAFCDSSEYEETEVLLFWSERADAEKHAREDWGRHIPTAIPIDEFVDRWLHGMEQDGLLVGPNWDAELEGLEIEPGELAENLTDDDPA